MSLIRSPANATAPQPRRERDSSANASRHPCRRVTFLWSRLWNVRIWLVASFRRRAEYVGSAPSTGPSGSNVGFGAVFVRSSPSSGRSRAHGERAKMTHRRPSLSVSQRSHCSSHRIECAGTCPGKRAWIMERVQRRLAAILVSYSRLTTPQHRVSASVSSACQISVCRSELRCRQELGPCPLAI